MNKNQTIAVVVIILVVVAAVGWYCLSSEDKPGEITDAMGNTILLDEVPERITCVTVTATEMICNLGFSDNLVGATTDEGVYDVDSAIAGFSDFDLDYPGTIQKDLDSGTITNIGTWTGWTAESVAVSDPDLVIMDYDQVSTDSSRMTQLQSLGIACIVMYTESGIETIVKNYTMLGTALGAQTVANKICDRLEEIDDDIMSYASQYDASSLKVAHICYCWGSYYIYNSSNTLDTMLALGCKNALPTDASFTTITPEDIAAADPDLIVFDDMATYLDWSEVIAEWKADPVMGQIGAIKNDNIYCLEYAPFKATSYSTVHFIEGEALIATILFHEQLKVNLPNIITETNWKTYITWVDDLV